MNFLSSGFWKFWTFTHAYITIGMWWSVSGRAEEGNTQKEEIIKNILKVSFYSNTENWKLTRIALIATKVVCFSRLLKCLRSLYGKQCGPRSDCSYRSSLFWVTLFASIHNLSVMLGKYLQQTTSADDIFRCLFFLGTLRVNILANSTDPDEMQQKGNLIRVCSVLILYSLFSLEK